MAHDSEVGQLDLFSMSNDQRPHPLLLAEKHGFKLDYIDRDGNPAHYLYHAVQWTMALGAADRTAWTRLKNQIVRSTQQLKIYEMPYAAENEKTYQVDFIDQQGCYLVAQNMRVTGDRPQLKEIKDYLAAVGVEFDKLRRDPEKRQALAAIDRKRTIAIHEKAGYGQHSEVLRLKDRDVSIDVLQSLKASIAKVCSEPIWGKLFNAEYRAMFNMNAKMLTNILGCKSVRDGLPSLNLVWLTAAERTLQTALSQYNHLTSEQIEYLIDKIMRPIGEQLRGICEALNIDPISGKSLLE